MLTIPSAGKYMEQLDRSYIATENGSATGKKKCQFLIKLNIHLFDSTVLLLSIFPREMKLSSIENLYINVHSGFIAKNWKQPKSHLVS